MTAFVSLAFSIPLCERSFEHAEVWGCAPLASRCLDSLYALSSLRGPGANLPYCERKGYVAATIRNELTAGNLGISTHWLGPPLPSALHRTGAGAGCGTARPDVGDAGGAGKGGSERRGGTGQPLGSPRPRTILQQPTSVVFTKGRLIPTHLPN